MARAKGLANQAMRLQKAIDAVKHASSRYNAGPAKAALAGEEYWSIKDGPGLNDPVIENVFAVRQQAGDYLKAAQKLAHEIFLSLPAGTVLVGETATAWHTGCPHTPANLRQWEAKPHRQEYEDDLDVWWSLLSDSGVNNSDNGRPPGVYLGEEWEIDGETPKMSRKGWSRDYLEDSNLYRQGGDYPSNPVVARKAGEVEPGRYWLGGFIGASYAGQVNPLPALRKLFPGEWVGDGEKVTFDGKVIWSK
jgi:hypothetical protein